MAQEIAEDGRWVSESGKQRFKDYGDNAQLFHASETYRYMRCIPRLAYLHAHIDT